MEAGAFTIQNNASFDRNTAYDRGGAMLLNNTNSNISGNLYLRHNKAVYGRGGAICILKGEIIIQGNTSFDGNFAGVEGGALYILSAKFILYGNNSATIRRGEVHTNESAKANKCSTYTIPVDDSITFLHNTADYYGGCIFCWKECDVGFIGTVYFNDSAGSAIDLNQQSSITFTGDTYFYRNTGYNGGAIQCYDSNITLSGTVYFESNTAYLGGAMFLTGTSKLVFTPNLDVSFISNYANDSGGALYFRDYQCSLGSTVECFITIDSPISTISNISLHFENNSAGYTGSILYGGQFDKCRLFFKTNTEQPDLCACKAPSYSINALEALMNMSTIIQNEDSKLNIYSDAVSSPASKMRFCELDDKVNLFTAKKNVYPGQHFNISLIALGQTEYPVPTTVYWEKIYNNYYIRISEYRLSPPSNTIGSSCTTVSFQLYSGNVSYVNFKLYPANPCQNLIEGLTLDIYVLNCPIGFH